MVSDDLTLSKTEVAYRALRHEILTAKLRPGTALRLRALQDRHGLGWTPLREALSRLEAEHLVVSSNNRGYRVPELSEGELADLAQARLAVELPMLLGSIARGGAEWEDGIVTAHYRLSRCQSVAEDSSEGAVDEWDLRHEAFHTALLAASGSDWLARLRVVVADQYRRHHRSITALQLEASAELSPSDRDAFLRPLYEAQSIAGHTELMTAVLNRDAALAESLYRAHLGEVLRAFRPTPA